MRKRILFILVLLILGAILNVAVAWGLNVCYWPWSSTSSKESSEYYYLHRREAQALCIQFIDDVSNFHQNYAVGYETNHFGLATIDASHRQGGTCGTYLRIPNFENLAVNQRKIGFPWRTFSGIIINRGSEWIPARTTFGSEWDTSKETLYTPYGPVWSGITFNTIFYATLLWIPSRVPFLLRRRRRIRKGLCVKCAYPAMVNSGIPGASPNCTECRTPILLRIYFRGRKYESTLKKWSRTTLGYLILGLILNVAVAWGCALGLLSTREYTADRVTENEVWPAPIPDSWPEAPTMTVHIETCGASQFESKFEPPNPESLPSDSLFQKVMHTGWPLRVLSYEEHGIGGNSFIMFIARSPSISIDSNMVQQRQPNQLILPVDPLWINLILNTFFYAIVLWIPIASFNLHHRRRIRRGGAGMWFR